MPHASLVPLDSMIQIVDFRKDKREIWIPREAFAHVLCSASPDEVMNLEMILHQRWAIARLRVKHYAVVDDTVRLSFLEPESRLEFEHPWPQPVVN